MVDDRARDHVFGQGEGPMLHGTSLARERACENTR